ncbi:hypothetical protein [Hyphococcus sp.]|uniref:hypothetical protein n=1 Tax=Hyphococcus sp. TaxID=2038636 RepID=UPI0035C7570D
MRPATMFIVWTCAILWAAFVAQGFFAYMTLEGTGSGFTRGFNRLAAFFQWEAAALAAAVVSYLAGRGAPKGNISRFAARWPLYLSGGFFLVLILLYLVAVASSRIG